MISYFNLKIYEMILNKIHLILSFHPDDGTQAFVSGFGYTRYRGTLPSTLNIVNVPILSKNHCQEMYNKAQVFRKITENVVCAGYSEGNLILFIKLIYELY